MFSMEDLMNMHKYSSDEGVIKAEGFFAEAKKTKKETGKEFRLAHIAKMMTDVINPMNIKRPSMKSDKYSDIIKKIDATYGDFSKFENYKDIKSLITTAEVVASSDSKKQSKHINTAKNALKLLTDNKKDFAKAYKGDKKNKSSLEFITDRGKTKADNALVITYRTLVLGLILETNIIAKAMVVGLSTEKEVKSFDEYVNSSRFFETFRDKLSKIVDDKDMGKLISKAGDITLIGESTNMYGEAVLNVSEVTYIAEVSLVDISLLLKLGLAGLMYKICGIFRFLIYITLYCKYSIDEKIKEIKNILEFYNNSANDRLNGQEEIEDKVTQTTVDDVRTFEKAEADVNNIHVDKEFDF